jgi:TRAP-type C4-dicarboxylate transport system permease small subunit
MGGRLWFLAERLLEAVMAAFLLAMAVITGIDVIGRYVFNAPLRGGYEIVQYLMAVSVFAALPLAARAEGHLTISLFTGRLGGRARHWHRIVILIISAGTLAFLAWRMGAQAVVMDRRQMVSGSLGLPLAPVGWAMTGLAWLAVAVTLVLLVQALAGRQNTAAGRGEEVG